MQLPLLLLLLLSSKMDNNHNIVKKRQRQRKDRDNGNDKDKYFVTMQFLSYSSSPSLSSIMDKIHPFSQSEEKTKTGTMKKTNTKTKTKTAKGDIFYTPHNLKFPLQFGPSSVMDNIHPFSQREEKTQTKTTTPTPIQNFPCSLVPLQ